MEPYDVKRELRRAVRERLHELDRASVAGWSESVCARLEAWGPFRRAHVVMSFVALPGEVDVGSLGRVLLEAGKTLCLPSVDWELRTMAPAAVTSLSEGLVTRRHGVQEPPEGAVRLDPHEVDLVLVPGLAFDEAGNRLGRGAGFYDRFLAHPALRATTCGVASEAQLVQCVPVEPHDRPLDAIVTERRLIVRPAE